MTFAVGGASKVVTIMIVCYLWKLPELTNREDGSPEVQQICGRHILIAFCANANAALANQNQREE